MNTARYVDEKIAAMKEKGIPLSDAAWEAALACEGWPYVFGAWGAECTVSERKKRYRDDHPTIKTKCKAFDGGSCEGCQWFPGGERVRCFDCRGFPDWVLKQFGIDLEGEGATSQWNTDSNWSQKGKISDGMPENVLVCLFVQKNGKMQHTGFGYKGETCECSSGVEHFTKRNKKWTHWAIPRGINGDTTITPTAEKKTGTPTLKRGSKGENVVKIQTMLDKLGYDLGECGIDGDYGKMTQCAIMNFQSDRGLARDGVCGAKTWEALENAVADLRPVTEPLYCVHIPHCTVYQAEAILNQYAVAYKTAEEGRG